MMAYYDKVNVLGSQEAETFFEQELVRWKKVIDTAGIKLER